MLYFFCGFGAGIYVGTYYDCKPYLDNIVKVVKENFPKEKDNNDDKNK